ncbi:hypothetical protein AAFX91_16280 [Bradyrhizobium sp. 31Argb]|uniref:hypothetical protein n=1 Tax=unclassified Bradyrhizobium TaxID=2631580 RepID=UPI00249F11E5|nr:hypothetical protein [Bradyrhizobium sp. Arg237L]MDI4234765.1 hypothetical protein [Bradyrhizobium sp. Arg237L]
MKGLRGFPVLVTTLAVSVVGLSGNAAAFDLTGAWATSADQCSKVFTRKGRAKLVTFTNFPGVHGGGFIAEPNRLRAKYATCSIKSRKDNDENVNMVVGCASGIMLENIQLFFKVVDDDTITRLFPGIEGMEVTYHRCKS